jgi:exosome complex protein LRP1
LERAERQAKERARAAVKAAMINKKFDDDGKEIKKNGNVTPSKRAAEDQTPPALDEEGDDDDEVISGLEEPQSDALGGPMTKRSKLSKEGHKDDSARSASEAKKKHKKSSRGRKKGKISGL